MHPSEQTHSVLGLPGAKRSGEHPVSDAQHPEPEWIAGAETVLETLFNVLGELVLIFDSTGCIRHCSRAARELLGFNPTGMGLAELIGRAQMECVEGNGFKPPSGTLAQLFEGHRVYRQALVLLDGSGRKRTLNVTAAPLRDNGRVAGALLAGRDTLAVPHATPMTAEPELRALLTVADTSSEGAPGAEERGPQERTRHDLEALVAERTAHLRATILALESEVSKRRQAEKDLLRSQQELWRLSRRTLMTLEADRQSISKELHDSIGVSLSAIKLRLEEKLANAVSRKPGGARKAPEQDRLLRKILDALVDTIKDTKRVAARLRPLTLDDLGLLSTIQAYCREFGDVYADIKIETTIKIREADIHPDQKIVIYRVLQEGMQNAARHGEPQTIRITLVRHHDIIEFRLEDDGRGFEPSAQVHANDPLSGHGITGMRERVTIVGGHFGLESRIRGGTRLRVVLPVGSCG